MALDNYLHDVSGTPFVHYLCNLNWKRFCVVGGWGWGVVKLYVRACVFACVCACECVCVCVCVCV